MPCQQLKERDGEGQLEAPGSREAGWSEHLVLCTVLLELLIVPWASQQQEWTGDAGAEVMRPGGNNGWLRLPGI